MNRPETPAPHLLTGLRRLVADIRASEAQDARSLVRSSCEHTELICFAGSGVCYRGERVDELARQPLFERIVWLLLNRDLPTDEQLADCSSVAADSAVCEQAMSEISERLPVNARPLDLFAFCLSLLKFHDPTPQDSSVEAGRWRVWRVLAQLPLLLSDALNGRRDGQQSVAALEPVEKELTWAGRLLSCIRPAGERPSAAEDAAMNVLMICECLTDMRPACFTARFTASATNNVVAAVESAATVFVAQLTRDPFQWTSELLSGFRDPAHAEAWWRRREGQPMPFGFVETSDDTRAMILTDACRTLLGSTDRIRFEACAARLESLLLAENCVATTDWAAARLMTLLDIPADRQSAVIGIARLVGWAAHAVEQQSLRTSLLPSLRYVAPNESAE